MSHEHSSGIRGALDELCRELFVPAGPDAVVDQTLLCQVSSSEAFLIVKDGGAAGPEASAAAGPESDVTRKMSGPLQISAASR